MKGKVYKYRVIGGQYYYYDHGGANTLLGAKRLAGKCREYWDNWQGWRVPAVYLTEDCLVRNGEHYPRGDARPAAEHVNGRWSA